MIITIANLKGGCGKTTLSIHLASAISGSATVILLDADPQGSCLAWIDQRVTDSHFPVISAVSDNLHQTIGSLTSGYRHGVIDTPPRSSAITRSAILAADLVVIPIQPSAYDVWSAQTTFEMVVKAREYKPQLKAAILINRVIHRSLIFTQTLEAISSLTDIPVMTNHLSSRVSFSEAASGYSVTEFNPGGIAALEVTHVSKELLKIMGEDRW